MKDVRSYEYHECLDGVSVPSDGYFLDTGTRHYVRIVEGVDSYDVVREGRDIRYNASELQPIGANVNFIESSDKGVLKVRTYEKGVEDETFACGTGIVASCIAAYKAGIMPTESLCNSVSYDVMAKRDFLKVSFRPMEVSDGVAEEVYLTGPATFVAEVEVRL
jgi:diaminopimelate epimerase